MSLTLSGTGSNVSLVPSGSLRGMMSRRGAPDDVLLPDELDPSSVEQLPAVDLEHELVRADRPERGEVLHELALEVLDRSRRLGDEEQRLERRERGRGRYPKAEHPGQGVGGGKAGGGRTA